MQRRPTHYHMSLTSSAIVGGHYGSYATFEVDVPLEDVDGIRGNVARVAYLLRLLADRLEHPTAGVIVTDS